MIQNINGCIYGLVSTGIFISSLIFIEIQLIVIVIFYPLELGLQRPSS